MRQELFINKQLADLETGISVPLTFQIADILEPSKRNSNFSKTVALPGTKTNNRILSNIFEINKEVLSNDLSVNYNPDFNPNLKADVVYFIDGFEQFKGFARLRDVVINNEGSDRRITYNIELFGNIANIFQELDNLNLQDIDFSEYDHDWTMANQVDSWDTQIVKDGVPLANFSGTPTAQFVNGPPDGVGYVYPIVNNGTTDLFNYNVTGLFPAIYVKEYIDKVFEQAGFTYTSAFFDSEYFKQLIIPFSGNQVGLTPAQVTSRLFQAGNTIAQVDNLSIPFVPDPPPNPPTFPGTNQGSEVVTIVIDDDSTGGNFDNGGNLDTSTYIYTVPANGRYQFDLDLTFDMDINEPVGTVFEQGFIEFKTTILNQTTGQVLGGDSQSVGTNSAVGQVVSISGAPFDLNQNDEIICKFEVSTTNKRFYAGPGATNQIELDADVDYTINDDVVFSNTVVNIPVVEGDTMVVNSVIPKIKAKDFLTSIIKMHNLYLDIDPEDERNLLVEPLVDFYDGNNTIDWTDKIDTSKEIKIEPVSKIDGKTYVFTYKEDKDFDNLEYTDQTFGKIYGEKSLDVQNDFVKQTKKFELIFSPTPCVGNAVNDMVVPRFVKEVPEGSGTVIKTDVNTRILIYSGLQTVGGNWTHKSTLVADVLRTTWACANHLDHPYTPAKDILFEVPDLVFWGTPLTIGANYTNANLFNEYHKEFIEEITNKDSKIVTAYFNLKAEDIFKLDFADFIFIKDTVYRLNKVFDYDGTKAVTTKVRLTKLLGGVPFVPDVVLINDTPPVGPRSTTVDGGKDSIMNPFTFSKTNLLDGGEDEVQCPNNVVSIFNIDGGKI